MSTSYIHCVHVSCFSVRSVSASAESWKAAVDRAQAGGLVPAEALYRAAERLGMATRPMYVQLLLPVAQLEEGEGAVSFT
jgi:hypothetical protein